MNFEELKIGDVFVWREIRLIKVGNLKRYVKDNTYSLWVFNAFCFDDNSRRSILAECEVIKIS